MWKENLYAKMEKLEVQICRCTRQDLEVVPCLELFLYLKIHNENTVNGNFHLHFICRLILRFLLNTCMLERRTCIGKSNIEMPTMVTVLL